MLCVSVCILHFNKFYVILYNNKINYNVHISESSNFLKFFLFSFSLFLQKTYPKSYQYPEVNRVVGQVAIETRQGSQLPAMTLLWCLYLKMI